MTTYEHNGVIYTVTAENNVVTSFFVGDTVELFVGIPAPTIPDEYVTVAVPTGQWTAFGPYPVAVPPINMGFEMRLPLEAVTLGTYSFTFTGGIYNTETNELLIPVSASFTYQVKTATTLIFTFGEYTSSIKAKSIKAVYKQDHIELTVEGGACIIGFSNYAYTAHIYRNMVYGDLPNTFIENNPYSSTIVSLSTSQYGSVFNVVNTGGTDTHNLYILKDTAESQVCGFNTGMYNLYFEGDTNNIFSTGNTLYFYALWPNNNSAPYNTYAYNFVQTYDILGQDSVVIGQRELNYLDTEANTLHDIVYYRAILVDADEKDTNIKAPILDGRIDSPSYITWVHKVTLGAGTYYYRARLLAAKDSTLGGSDIITNNDSVIISDHILMYNTVSWTDYTALSSGTYYYRAEVLHNGDTIDSNVDSVTIENIIEPPYKLETPSVIVTVGTTSAQLTITPVTFATHYEVRCGYETPLTSAGQQIVQTTMLLGLSPLTTYYIQVRAINSNTGYQNSDWCTIIEVTTLEETIEGIPVKFIQTTSAKLDSIAIVAGNLIFVTDTQAIYLDTFEGTRVCVSAEASTLSRLTSVESRLTALET